LNVTLKDKPIRWAAEVPHVREVSLLGTADLAFWNDRLARDDLQPAEKNGRAQVLIIAGDMKYMGIRFREVSFSVLISRQDEGVLKDASCLVQAFNSVRFFAFCERKFFSTPYCHGDVRVSTTCPAAIQLFQGGEMLFEARMHTGAGVPPRVPARRGEEGWEGPVFLPPTRRGKAGPGNWFYASIRGQTEAYPFVPSHDGLTIRQAAGYDVLQTLLDSHFVASEWAIRTDATHAKSKTYKRDGAKGHVEP
jgi:hypothetical protein